MSDHAAIKERHRKAAHASPARNGALTPGPRVIREAKPEDIPALLMIEHQSFPTDRLSQRSFRYMLSKGNATTLVETDRAGEVRGYAMVSFHRNTPLARLYSIAVAPRWRGKGVGRALMRAAEDAAREEACAYLRLEVRAEDKDTQAFYRKLGYRPFGYHSQYYDDNADAVRMDKIIAPGLAPNVTRVPYYRQRLDFTCGPAAVMMGMHALDRKRPMTAIEELRIWRESTTIFMTQGHGGCSPHGLALAAFKRGFDVELYTNDRGVPFVETVRSELKRDVIRQVHADFLDELSKTAVTLVPRALNLAQMREKFDAGGIPIVLVSSYQFDRRKELHWVVVTGFDDTYVYVHDPYVDVAEAKSQTDRMHIPVPQRTFDRMARYGKRHKKAALIVKARPAGADKTK
ncbi:MAG TPA: GNAT family N-acetyltransferase/peptidase C39 family protein [Alphaproteobacteria bacterium]|jgi:ribosomal protein S18 acetylase RimI-like enzyme